jgi:hypothetical protein
MAIGKFQNYDVRHVMEIFQREFSKKKQRVFEQLA